LLFEVKEELRINYFPENIITWYLQNFANHTSFPSNTWVLRETLPKSEINKILRNAH